jgi:hypothetical protein
VYRFTAFACAQDLAWGEGRFRMGITPPSLWHLLYMTGTHGQHLIAFIFRIKKHKGEGG